MSIQLNPIMLSFVTQGFRFHLRAAAVVRHEGFILVHRAEGDNFWALPGGRVEPGEDASAAVVREMMEELGAEVLTGELAYVVENFFAYNGENHHEVGLYFATHLQAGSPLLKKDVTHEGVEGSKKLYFRWVKAVDLATTDLRPSFLQDVLAAEPAAFRHVVHRDRQEAA